MASDFQAIFGTLKRILQTHAADFCVKSNTANCYSLEAAPGPATLKAWGGKMRKPMIPVAWVQIGKSYVSFHLMGISENSKLQAGLSEELRARMQGKTCFNFSVADEKLFSELSDVTARGLAAFRKAGFVA